MTTRKSTSTAQIAARIIARFEEVTGEQASSYPDAKLMDLQAWTRDELDDQFRQRQVAKGIAQWPA